LCREFGLKAVEYTYGFDANNSRTTIRFNEIPCKFPYSACAAPADSATASFAVDRAALEDHARDYEIRGHVARLVDLWREVS
jgi:hypothetical protein